MEKIEDNNSNYVTVDREYIAELEKKQRESTGSRATSKAWTIHSTIWSNFWRHTMGTNYYAHKVDPTPRESERVVHIGKSSSGWLFLFHDCEFFHTYPQVRRWLREHISLKKEYVLMNEYGQIVDVEEFIMLVQNKQNDKNCRSNPDNFEYARNIDGYRFVDGEFY